MNYIWYKYEMNVNKEYLVFCRAGAAAPIPEDDDGEGKRLIGKRCGCGTWFVPLPPFFTHIGCTLGKTNN